MEARVTAMADTLEHRGPDSWAAWVDADAGIAFGHRRLAIVDLSETGAQPMTSSCGRFVICYNGMIYNAPKIRDELAAKGRTFRGSSDTEVMIEALIQGAVADFGTQVPFAKQSCFVARFFQQFGNRDLRRKHI